MFEVLHQVQQERLLLQSKSAPKTNSHNVEVLRRAEKDNELFGGDEFGRDRSIEIQSSFTNGLDQDGTNRIVQRLFLAPGIAAPKAVVFCNVEPNCAPNSICARVADLLSRQTRSSVCIVDAKVSRPSLHHYFATENRRGLVGAILESGPLVDFTRSLVPGLLQLMSAGVLSPGMEASTLLTSARLRTRMAEMRQSYNYVLWDAPSPLAAPTISALTAFANGVVLIAEPGATSQQAAREAKAAVEAVGSRVIGFILHRPEISLFNRSRNPY
jgi:Mrp family chromosome partitioning ATPase